MLGGYHTAHVRVSRRSSISSHKLSLGIMRCIRCVQAAEPGTLTSLRRKCQAPAQSVFGGSCSQVSSSAACFAVTQSPHFRATATVKRPRHLRSCLPLSVCNRIRSSSFTRCLPLSVCNALTLHNVKMHHVGSICWQFLAGLNAR